MMVDHTNPPTTTQHPTNQLMVVDFETDSVVHVEQLHHAGCVPQSVAWDAQQPAFLAVETTPHREGRRGAVGGDRSDSAQQQQQATKQQQTTQGQQQQIVPGQQASSVRPPEEAAATGPAVLTLLLPTPNKILIHCVEPLQHGWGLLSLGAPFVWLHAPLLQDTDLGKGAMGGGAVKHILTMYKGLIIVSSSNLGCDCMMWRLILFRFLFMLHLIFPSAYDIMYSACTHLLIIHTTSLDPPPHTGLTNVDQHAYTLLLQLSCHLHSGEAAKADAVVQQLSDQPALWLEFLRQCVKSNQPASAEV